MAQLDTTDLDKIGIDLYGRLSAEMSGEDDNSHVKLYASMIGFPPEKSTENVDNVPATSVIIYLQSRIRSCCILTN